MLAHKHISVIKKRHEFWLRQKKNKIKKHAWLRVFKYYDVADGSQYWSRDMLKEVPRIFIQHDLYSLMQFLDSKYIDPHYLA